MQLHSFVRLNRAVSAVLLLNEPLKGIALSECLSVLLPLLNIQTMYEQMGVIIAIAYAPHYSSAIIQKYSKQKNAKIIVYLQAEICCILLFISCWIVFHY